MSGRSGFLTFLVLLLAGILILLQFLSIMQTERLQERLEAVVATVENAAAAPPMVRPRQPAADADEPMQAVAQRAVQGDWLVWALGGEPRTLNPISVEGDTYTRYITTGNIFERLLEYDYDEAVLEPWLAEEFTIAEDGLSMTVRLRDDIVFSDGEPMTADDILFTYNTIMDPGIDAAVIRAYYENFKGVEKLDDLTVRFSFNEVFWKTLEAVGLFDVLPEHIYKYGDPKEFNQRISDPVGSGPYIFDKWDVGQQIVLRRNERYWKEQPNVDRMVFRFVTNDLAAIQSLRGGQADMLIPSPEQFADLSQDPTFTEDFHTLEFWAPGVPYFFIAWNQATPFFGDSRVRLAMTHLVDREAIVKHILKGHAEVTTGPFYIRGEQNNPDVEPWPYDLARAKELLAEAGWTDTNGDGLLDKDGRVFRFKYMYPSGRMTYEQIAKLLKDSAAKVGIDVQPDPIEWSIFLQRITGREFEAATMGFGGTIESDPYQNFHSSQIEGNGDNWVGFRNERADEIIEIGRRTLDPEKRYALYHEFHELIHQEQPYTFLFTRPQFRFIDKRFENVIVHELGLNFFEWYVPLDEQRYK